MVIEKGLLLHWWHYYGKNVYTLEELEKFEKIIDDYGVDKVLEAAIASYISCDGSPTTILLSIRTNKVKELFDSLPNLENLPESIKVNHEKVKSEFIKKITETYKNN